MSCVENAVQLCRLHRSVQSRISQNREKSTSHDRTRSDGTPNSCCTLPAEIANLALASTWTIRIRCPGLAVKSDGQRPSESPGFERLGIGLGQINLAPAGWPAGLLRPLSQRRVGNWLRATPGRSASTTPHDRSTAGQQCSITEAGGRIGPCPGPRVGVRADRTQKACHGVSKSRIAK